MVWHVPEANTAPAPQISTRERDTAKAPRLRIPSFAEFNAYPDRYSEEEVEALIQMVNKERFRWTMTRGICVTVMIGLHLWALLYLPLYLLGRT